MRKLQLPAREKNGARLEEKDIQLVRKKGIDGLKSQARKIVEEKLREQPENDGKQTPVAGNPVYKAMHACHCDSRRRLSRAHRVPAGRELSDDEIEAIVNLLTRWIVREHNFFREEVKKKQGKLSEF